MGRISVRPDLGDLEVPMDAWTRPFWDATAQGRLVFPRCGECGTFRWPPGPFCPECRSQAVEWRPAGEGQVYSYTIVPAGADREGALVPALIAFADAGGVRLPAAIVDTDVDAIAIGARATLDFSPAANAAVPVFTLR